MDTNCTPYLRMCMVTYTHTITCTNPFSGAANHTWKLVLSTSYCKCKTGCFKCKHYIFLAVCCFYNKSLFLYFSLLTLAFPLLLFHFFLVIDCKESWVARNLCSLLFDIELWDMLFGWDPKYLLKDWEGQKETRNYPKGQKFLFWWGGYIVGRGHVILK